MTNTIGRLISKGTALYEKDPKVVRRARFLNAFLLFICLSLALYSLSRLSQGEWYAALIDWLLLGSIFLIYVLNTKGKFRFALPAVLVMLGLGCTFLGYLYGNTAEVQYYFFAAAMFPFMFYDRRGPLVFFSLFYFGLFLYVDLDLSTRPPQTGNQQASAFHYILTVLISFGALCVMSFYFKNEHLSYESLIENKKEELDNAYAHLQIEKEKSDSLLRNILPEEVAEELKERGNSEAKAFEEVTVLFTDFKEFTETSEKLSARELVAEINECFKAFDRICDRYSVEKIKTIGDAYMAAGGLPVPDRESVRNAVLAGLEMADFMIERKKLLEAENRTTFEMRIGIHTGPVIAGIVGIKKFQYDIWGDTVNTAARMEANGETGKINISQNTYDLIKDDPQFKFEYRGKVSAKGKGEVDMYFVCWNGSPEPAASAILPQGAATGSYPEP